MPQRRSDLPPESVMIRSVDDPKAILQSPAFQNLVAMRSRFAWTLSLITLVVYLAFIFLVAFAHDLMATKIGGGPTSLGIVLGLAVIVFSFVMTGIYVQRANGLFDDLTRDVTGGRP